MPLTSRVSVVSRRALLQRSSVGFGSLALASMLANDTSATAASADPLAARQPHFPARAKRIIFLLMSGGPSQVDTFDPKPLLTRDDGKPLPFAKPRVQFNATSNLLKSPWRFRQYGDSGLPVSELFPHLAQRVDDLCMIHSIHGTNPAHGGAMMKLHTGSDNFIRPSIGSWVSYGLGTDNANLPAFVTICPTLAFGGINNWSTAFLPAVYQGTPLGDASVPSNKARVKFINNSLLSREVRFRMPRTGPASVTAFSICGRICRGTSKSPAARCVPGASPEFGSRVSRARAAWPATQPSA